MTLDSGRGFAGLCAFAGGLLMLAMPTHAQQTPKKGSSTPRTQPSVCAYASRYYRANSYQLHGLACQQCVSTGEWVDVGGQECDAHPKNPATKQGKAKGHQCSKDDGAYSVGAIFANPDDCSRCTNRTSPDDWDSIDKMYFCEKLNPAGDVD